MLLNVSVPKISRKKVVSISPQNIFYKGTAVIEQ